MLLTEWPDTLWEPSPPPGARSDVRMSAGSYVDRGLDPGHLFTADEWATIVARAESTVPGGTVPHRYGVAGGGPDGVVTARYNGGKMAGPPTFVTIHDAETPLADGYVASIAEMFRRGPAAGTSAHHMVGPRTWLQLLPEDVVAYAAGPKGNPRGVHIEQAGYASFTRTQWTSPDGLAQVSRLADCVRAACTRWGIPMRWATDAQLRAAATGGAPAGLVTHAQIARVLGGTTHTDPEPNYPGDLLLGALLIGGNGMAELTGKSLELLQDVQYRVRGTEPNLDTLQVLNWKLDGALGLLQGASSDRIGDLWNQGGAILGALAGLEGQLHALQDQLSALRSAGGAGGPSAEQIAAAVVALQNRQARDGDPATGPVS